MKIIFYSQHIWGVGHFFRNLEICKALADHEVIMVTGGDPVTVSLPRHVRLIRLAGIMAGRHPKELVSNEKGMTLAEVKARRKETLYGLFLKERPDVFIIEFYPFGRNAFRFELEPILEAIRRKELPRCRVICSIRDILVEKGDTEFYETRVIKRLGRHFDALLVHADPNVVKLDDTFSRVCDIPVPIVYTGYVTAKPDPDARFGLRKRLGIGEAEFLIAGSAGGGKSGGELLQATIEAFNAAAWKNSAHLHLFTGPYLDEKTFRQLTVQSDERVRVSRFSTDFLSYLAGADLSISMAGYNTCMNILASGVKALVRPFGYDREQGMRAERLAAKGALHVLTDGDLDPARLQAMISRMLRGHPKKAVVIDLEGAARTAQWLEACLP